MLSMRSTTNRVWLFDVGVDAQILYKSEKNNMRLPHKNLYNNSIAILSYLNTFCYEQFLFFDVSRYDFLFRLLVILTSLICL